MKHYNDLVSIILGSFIAHVTVIWLFVGLAIQFDKWWIVLLSWLFIPRFNYSNDDKKEDK